MFQNICLFQKIRIESIFLLSVFFYQNVKSLKFFCIDQKCSWREPRAFILSVIRQETGERLEHPSENNPSKLLLLTS